MSNVETNDPPSDARLASSTLQTASAASAYAENKEIPPTKRPPPAEDDRPIHGVGSYQKILDDAVQPALSTKAPLAHMEPDQPAVRTNVKAADAKQSTRRSSIDNDGRNTGSRSQTPQESSRGPSRGTPGANNASGKAPARAVTTSGKSVTSSKPASGDISRAPSHKSANIGSNPPKPSGVKSAQATGTRPSKPVDPRSSKPPLSSRTARQVPPSNVKTAPRDNRVMNSHRDNFEEDEHTERDDFEVESDGEYETEDAHVQIEIPPKSKGSKGPDTRQGLKQAKTKPSPSSLKDSSRASTVTKSRQKVDFAPDAKQVPISESINISPLEQSSVFIAAQPFPYQQMSLPGSAYMPNPSSAHASLIMPAVPQPYMGFHTYSQVPYYAMQSSQSVRSFVSPVLPFTKCLLSLSCLFVSMSVINTSYPHATDAPRHSAPVSFILSFAFPVRSARIYWYSFCVCVSNLTGSCWDRRTTTPSSQYQDYQTLQRRSSQSGQLQQATSYAPMAPQQSSLSFHSPEPLESQSDMIMELASMRQVRISQELYTLLTDLRLCLNGDRFNACCTFRYRVQALLKRQEQVGQEINVLDSRLRKHAESKAAQRYMQSEVFNIH
jgi:hypothetical protein